MKTVLVCLTLSITAFGLGCATLSEYVTPATVDRRAVAYVAKAGVADANDFRGYANLEKAIRLEVAVEHAYDVKSLALEQMAEQNQLDYTALKGVTLNNTATARQREEVLFGETGLLSMGLTALGFGTFTGFLGLMRKRPGDVTREEMTSALAGVAGEVTTKHRQMTEIIKGVQAYLDTLHDGGMAAALKGTLSQHESADTKQVVGMVKAGLFA